MHFIHSKIKNSPVLLQQLPSLGNRLDRFHMEARHTNADRHCCSCCSLLNRRTNKSHLNVVIKIREKNNCELSHLRCGF